MNAFAVDRLSRLLERAALRSVAAHHYFDDEDPNADAAAAYADEQLALAARDLACAVEALPASERPIGWDKDSFGPFSTAEPGAGEAVAR